MDFSLEITHIDPKFNSTIQVGEKFTRQASQETQFSVGRSGTSDILIPCTIVNRQCFTLFYKDGEFSIASLRASPGLFVNGSLVNPEQPPIRLNNNDEVRIGKNGVVIHFRCSAVPHLDSTNIKKDEKPIKITSPLKSAISETQADKQSSPKVTSPVRFAEPLITSPVADNADFYDINAVASEHESPIRRELSPSVKAAIIRSPTKSPRSPIREANGSPRAAEILATPKNDKTTIEQIGYALATPLRIVASPFRPAKQEDQKDKSMLGKTLSAVGTVLASPVVIPARIVSAAFSGTLGRQRAISGIQSDISATARTAADSDIPSPKARRAEIASPTIQVPSLK